MKKLLACLALSTILLTGCSFNNNSEAIISVNGKQITQADFDKALDSSIDPKLAKSIGVSKDTLKSEDNPMFNIFKGKIVNELIVKTLLDEEIEKRGITVSQEDVQKEIQSIVDKVGSKEELNKLLKQRGVSNSQFTDDLKTQIKVKKLVNSIKKIEVSDSDAEKYYNAHKSEFVHGEEVRASHILISANTIELIQEFKEKNPNLTPTELNKKVDEKLASQKKKAQAILEEVKRNPEQFAKIAQEKSDDKGSAERGGELGFFSKEVMVPEFSKAAFSMKPNTISETLVESPYGYHIIKVTDRVEAGAMPFAKIKDDIKFYLETEQQLKTLKDFTDGLLKNAKIEYLNEKYNPNFNDKKEVKEDKTANNK